MSIGDNAVPINLFIDVPTRRLLNVRAASLGLAPEDLLADIITNRVGSGDERPETPRFLRVIEGGRNG